MICTNCLCEIPAGARFCKECGHAVQISKGAKASKSRISWKWALGIFGAVVVAWALAEWAPDTEPAQSPETELDQAPDPAPFQPPTSAAERATLTNDPRWAVPQAEQKPDTGGWNLRTEV